MRLKLLIGLALLLLLAWSGCSDDDSGTGGDNDEVTTASDTIGTAGGTVEITGRVSLEVPPDALSSDVEITIEKNSSPGSPGGTKKFVSTVYTVGPSGTTFDTPAEITLNYNQSALGGASEGSVVIYTNEGSGWSSLTSSVNTTANTVSAAISHLSDFGAVVDTASGSEPAEGVFAVLSVDRGITYIPADPYPMLLAMDAIWARFDTAIAPCWPVNPLQPDSVKCGAYELSWSSQNYRFEYMPYDMFLELGGTYVFNVYGGISMPDLVDTIQFPETAPYITNPIMGTTVSSMGFTVTWANGGGTIYLSLISEDDLLNYVEGDPTSVDGVFVQTDGSAGSYAFSSSQLGEIGAGSCMLILNRFNKEFITADGYDSRSFIVAKTTSMVTITLQ